MGILERNYRIEFENEDNFIDYGNNIYVWIVGV